MLAKYFERAGTGWQVTESVRRLVQYSETNLVRPWVGVGTADIVFIRNVLIYFDVPTKREILGRIRNVLAPDGYLFLGSVETTLEIDPSLPTNAHRPGHLLPATGCGDHMSVMHDHLTTIMNDVWSAIFGEGNPLQDAEGGIITGPGLMAQVRISGTHPCTVTIATGATSNSTAVCSSLASTR